MLNFIRDKKHYLFFPFFIVGLLILFLPRGIAPTPSRSVYYLWESGHILLFFLGCSLLHAASPQLQKLAFTRQAVILLGISLCAVLFVEGLQSALSEKAVELSDVIGDVSGTFLFLSFRAWHQGKNSLVLYGLTLAVTGVTVWPVLWSLADEALARYQFPLLAGFETPFEASRFEGKTGQGVRSAEQAFHGKYSLRLSLFPRPWSGVMLKHLAGDWQRYTRLHFAVYNPGRQAVALHVRIHDERYEQGDAPFSDLYSRELWLPPGVWTKLVIPLEEVEKGPQGRLMEMDKIRGFGLFVEKETHPLVLYLDALGLE